VPDKNELPPMGLPIREQSSSNYLLGLTVATLATGAVVFALGYGAMQATSGPCDALYSDSVDGLKAQVEFLKKEGAALGINAVEVQELRASTNVAGDALRNCCEQRQDGAISEERFEQCNAQATVMAGLPDELIAARDEADAAKQAVRNTATRLRNIAGDLSDLSLPAVASSESKTGASPAEQ
jgi:uncharacterized protein YdeI (YjbR/CyaY-like superfamily)